MKDCQYCGGTGADEDLHSCHMCNGTGIMADSGGCSSMILLLILLSSVLYQIS